MRTKSTIILGSLIVAVLIFSAAAMMISANEAKESAEVAVEKSPAIDGDWALSTPPGLEKIEFIHYKKDGD